jgi:glycosyltransferase involved in cell wall biosynthesis
MNEPCVGVIVPAYNEAGKIAEVLEEVPDHITVDGKRYKILTIAVDDGSSDGTADAAAQVSGVAVVRHIINSGAGAATRTGLHYARREGCVAAVTMDADGQHRIKDTLAVLAEAIRGNGDLVIGSRLINTEGMPAYKILGNKGLSIITFILMGVSTTDSQSGLRGFSQQALHSLVFHENRYAFCSEMIWRAKRSGMRITEVPIEAVYTDYSQGKGQSSWNGFNIVKHLIKHRLSGLFNE